MFETVLSQFSKSSACVFRNCTLQLKKTNKPRYTHTYSACHTSFNLPIIALFLGSMAKFLNAVVAALITGSWLASISAMMAGSPFVFLTTLRI